MDEQGKFVGAVHVARDVTDRKRAEESLAHERFLLSTLMDHIPDQIYFKDQESRFLRINKAQAEIFGLEDAGRAIGKTDFDFFTEEHARAAYEDEQQIMRTGQPLVGKEEKETFGEGRVRWVSSTKMPFRDKDGTVAGTFGVSRDITKLKLAEEALRQSRQDRTRGEVADDGGVLTPRRGARWSDETIGSSLCRRDALTYQSFLDACTPTIVGWWMSAGGAASLTISNTALWQTAGNGCEKAYLELDAAGGLLGSTAQTSPAAVTETRARKDERAGLLCAVSRDIQRTCP
jgi:PAS domain S-box-containing protein